MLGSVARLWLLGPSLALVLADKNCGFLAPCTASEFEIVSFRRACTRISCYYRSLGSEVGRVNALIWNWKLPTRLPGSYIASAGAYKRGVSNKRNASNMGDRLRQSAER